jgi:hypothetical protein
MNRKKNKLEKKEWKKKSNKKEICFAQFVEERNWLKQKTE